MNDEGSWLTAWSVNLKTMILRKVGQVLDFYYMRSCVIFKEFEEKLLLNMCNLLLLN